MERYLVKGETRNKRKRRDAKKKNRKIWTLSILALVVTIFIILSVSSAIKASNNNGDFFDKVFSTFFSKESEDIKEQEWNLVLVNRWNSIPKNYKPKLTELSNGERVDSRIYPHLQKMFDDARDEGIFISITSGYRNAQLQQTLLNQKINEYKEQGIDSNEAKELALGWVALPGTSEHELGLAVDLGFDWSASSSSEDIYYWLENNAHNYGFIMRYTEDKIELTGVNFEPWHYRYVGEDVAKEIVSKGICFEEYISALNE